MGQPLAQSELVCAGRYRLEERLGEGAVGIVWSAIEMESGRSVALKFLKPHCAADPRMLKRFRREGRAAAAIVHPNIVSIFDVDTSDETSPVIVMERLHGETLRDRLTRDKRLDVPETLHILRLTVRAVDAAHAALVLHRDLKPDNIFLCQDQEPEHDVRVLDFGLAKPISSAMFESSSLGLTATGAMLGTPYYMSPEQVFGERDLQAATDVWSLGIILYECLTGVRPTEGANVGQVFKRITKNDLIPIEKLVPTLPKQLTALIGNMLSATPSARPSLVEIERIFDRLARDPNAHDSSLEDDSAATSQERLKRLPSVHTAEASERRRRWLPIVVLALMALVAAAIALRTFTLPQNETREPQALPKAPQLEPKSVHIPEPVAPSLSPSAEPTPSVTKPRPNPSATSARPVVKVPQKPPAPRPSASSNQPSWADPGYF